VEYDNLGADNLLSKDIHTYEEMVQRAAEAALAVTFARPADSIVVVADIPFGEAGTTNTLRIEQMVVPHEWSSECLKLAQNGNADAVAGCLLLRDERTYLRHGPSRQIQVSSPANLFSLFLRQQHYLQGTFVQ
jgi:hypothetical protein